MDVELSGVIPGGEPARGILAAAIRECATNTVKHAGGDRLAVTVRPAPGETGTGASAVHGEAGAEQTLVLRLESGGSSASTGTPVRESGGTVPGTPVRESGGLSTLRTLVERASGTMQTEAAPDAFRVVITLPV